MKEEAAPFRFFPELPLFFSLKPVNFSGSAGYMEKSDFSLGSLGCYCWAWGLLKSLAIFIPASQSAVVKVV